MKVIDAFDLDWLLQCGFKKTEHVMWFNHPRTEYTWTPKGRRKPTILIFENEEPDWCPDANRKVYFVNNAQYYYDDIPDFLIDLIKNEIIVEEV